MTKHEADVIGGLNMTDQISNEVYKQIMIAAQNENEPCEDCISRQAVLDKLNWLIEVERLQGTDEMGYDRERVSAYESMIFEIESEYLYPPVTPQPKTGWIHVSERMPKDGQNVLFCVIDEDIMIGYHVKGEPDTHFV